jgi:hypothetical protein
MSEMNDLQQQHVECIWSTHGLLLRLLDLSLRQAVTARPVA